MARSGMPTATHAGRHAGRAIGRLAASCVNLLTPSVIVLGGMVSDVGEHLLSGIREVVYSPSLPLATQNLRIVVSKPAGQAGVLGAAQMVIQETLAPRAINRLLAAEQRTAGRYSLA